MFPIKSIPTLPIGIHRYERGLYVRVTDHSRSWLYKYQLNGKRREIGLGSAVGQPVSAVLAKVTQLKAQVAQGIDPKVQIDQVKEEKKAENVKASMPTFAEYADKAFEKILYLRRFQGAKTESLWRHDIKRMKEAFGNQRLDAITRDDVATFLRQWWTTQPNIGKYLRLRLEAILNVAKGEGLISTNVAEWKGCLDAVLPSLGVVRRAFPTKHHNALSPEDLREVVQELWVVDRTSALCVVFGALSAGRISEYCKGRWDEVDLEEKVFLVPQARRKDKKPHPHRVPLTRQMVKLLHRLDTSGDHIFQGRGSKPIDTATALSCLKNATSKPVTLHGMRSTFSDWCAKNEKNFLVSEKQLMHAVGNAVFQAYQRDDLLDQRRVLMQEWADYLLPDV